MKTWLYALAGATLLNQASFAQEFNEEPVRAKKIHAGLALTSGVLPTNFETNTINRRGLGGFFGLGFGANINFASNVGLYTGLEFHFERFSFEPNETDFRYEFNDKAILLNKDNDAERSSAASDRHCWGHKY